MTIVRQSRMKITWFGAIAMSAIMLVCAILKVENLSTIISVGFPSLTTLILGYQGSRAITKSAAIRSGKEVQE